MVRIIRFLVVALVVICGLAVHLRNDQSILFDYYLGTIEGPFSLFLILALIVGVLLGGVTCLPGLLKMKRENRAQAAHIRNIEKELDNLRIIPARN